MSLVVFQELFLLPTLYVVCQILCNSLFRILQTFLEHGQGLSFYYYYDHSSSWDLLLEKMLKLTLCEFPLYLHYRPLLAKEKKVLTLTQN